MSGAGSTVVLFEQVFDTGCSGPLADGPARRRTRLSAVAVGERRAGRGPRGPCGTRGPHGPLGPPPGHVARRRAVGAGKHRGPATADGRHAPCTQHTQHTRRPGKESRPMRSYGEVIDVRTTRAGGTAALPSSSSGGVGSTSSATCSRTGWSSAPGGSPRPSRPRRRRCPPGSRRRARCTRPGPVALGGRRRRRGRARGVARRGRPRPQRPPRRLRPRPRRARHRGALRPHDPGLAAYDVGRGPDDLEAPGLRPGGHRPDAPARWRLARALD